MAKYTRKTEDYYTLLANYGYGHGWEEETEESSLSAIREQIKTYRENAPKYSYKWVKRRRPIATAVFFRKLEGEIIAIFPEIAADSNPDNCLTYQHIGQHGAGNYRHLLFCEHVLPKEYLALKTELESIGYVLEIKHTRHPKYYIFEMDAKKKRIKELEK